MLHEKSIPSAKFRIVRIWLKRKPSLGKFVTQVLIFRDSRSHMFFKIGDLKYFAILEPFLVKL